MKYEFAILPIEQIKEHEEINEDYLKELAAQIKKDGEVRLPILVEKKHYVCLDGHHRLLALKLLNCKRVPVYLVDYADDDIKVDLWPTANIDRVTKEEVIRMAISGKKYTPKTTKHVLKEKLPEHPVSLEELM